MDEATRKARWDALFAVVGKHAVRNACDVSDSTLWRWVVGIATPSSSRRAKVNAMCVRHRLALVFDNETEGSTDARK